MRKDVQRLVRIAERIEAEEARMQRVYGNRAKGSQRSALLLDAKAIRSVLATLEGLTNYKDNPFPRTPLIQAHHPG